MRKLLAICALTLSLTGIAVPVFAEELDPPPQSCTEDFTCTCNGQSYTAVQTNMSGIVDYQGGSSACSQECRNAELTGTWELYCSGRLVNRGDIPSTVTPVEKEKRVYQVPNLAVPIPGLTFTAAQDIDGNIATNYIGQYVAVVYNLAIVIGTIGVVLTIMIAGLRWMVARGDAGAVGAAKESIGKALMALFILLSVTLIARLVDPSLLRLDGLRIPIIERIEVAFSFGEEGAPGGGDAASCDEAEANAKRDYPCDKPETIGSPTGNPYSCNYHFRDENYNYKSIKALDYGASFGSPIRAPFTGSVSYVQGTGGDRCGNRIRLIGNGMSITMCHVKDFLDNSGTALRNGATVQKGDIIGHAGGACCKGENPPSDWSQSDKCTVAGTPCTDPTKNESCQCQPYTQSGNTSGPHVHISYTSTDGYLLSCIE